MTEAQNPTPNTSGVTQTGFLNNTETAEKDSIYNDFFQENAEGEIQRKVKTERSGLEIFTNIMSFIIPILLIATLLWSIHTFVKSQTDSSFVEKFPFLCSYMNSDIEWLSEDEKWCKTSIIIKEEFDNKTTALENEIVSKLSSYLPIKLSSNNINEKEQEFIKKTFEDKISIKNIMDDFNKVIDKAQTKGNISCKNMSINNIWTINVQCEILGWEIGAKSIKTGTRVDLWSSRIEASNFIMILSQTAKTNFILINPPTILSVENISNKKSDVPSLFQTRTNINLTMKYAPLSSQL